MPVTVFHIIAHAALGGAERVALNLATSQSTQIEYHVVEVLRGNDSVTQGLLAELKDAGVKVHRSVISHHKLGILLFSLRFLALMLRYRADVIHTHTELPDVSIYLWHLLFGWIFPHTRYVRTIHNTELWNSWKWLGRLVEPFFQRKRANIAIGKDSASAYERVYGSPVMVIPNGVKNTQQARFPGLVPHKCNVVFAGRMEQQKGISVLIKTVQQLADNPNIIFHIIGGGSLHTELVRSIGSLPTVRLYDRIHGLSSMLGQVDYVFVPSVFEGLGLISLEASLAGVPVIANRCPGLTETLPDDWPLFAEGNDAETYVQLLTTPRSAEELAGLIAQARAHVNQIFSLENMRKRYERVYLKKS